MKYIKWIRVVLLLLAVLALPMLLPGPGGEPVMKPSDWLPGERSLSESWHSIKGLLYKSGDISERELGLRVGLERPGYYRWQDEQGRWHFSSEPPAEQVVERQALPEPANIMESTNTGSSSGSTLALPGGLSVDSIVEKLEQARQGANAGEQ